VEQNHSEIEKQKSFISQERDYLSKEKQNIEKKRSLSSMYIPANLKQILRKKSSWNQPLAKSTNTSLTRLPDSTKNSDGNNPGFKTWRTKQKLA